jgi:hypothetical protein
MADSPDLMDLSSGPPESPQTPNPTQATLPTPENRTNSASSPILPFLNLTSSNTALNVGFEPSSDPLNTPFAFEGENFSSASQNGPSANHGNRPRPKKASSKRTLDRSFLNVQDPENLSMNKQLRRDPDTSSTPLDEEHSISARTKILQARDLIIQACTLTTVRDEQSRLLDLLEVFREFTERGQLSKASNIIASQVANLEAATRRIETYASVASKPSTTTSTRASTSSPPSARRAATATSVPAVSPSPKSKAAKPVTHASKKSRLVLVRSPTGQPFQFSAFTLRNAFNRAFEDKGVQGPVVASVTKSLGQNIIITTTESFSADFLLDKRGIWEHVVPFHSAQKDEPWHKVVLHGIPTADFDTATGMETVVEEIKIFNKGFNPIGTPYWLTPADRRPHQRAGSVVVAFATADEASRAIRHRLYVAGISVRVEKLHSTAPSTQCGKCQGFGHIDNHCRRQAKCRLCAEPHSTIQHYCTTCKAKGSHCPHLVPKCINCKEAHTAEHKTCEILLAIKRKTTASYE